MLSPATRSPWVPSRHAEGGTVIGKTREERGNCLYSSRRSTLVEDEQNMDIAFRVLNATIVLKERERAMRASIKNNSY